MTAQHAIDAFIDGETVDATALDAALASAEGRAYLIDVLSLRGLMNDAPDEAATASPRRAGALHFYARVAVAALALLGIGYAAGARFNPSRQDVLPSATTARASDTAPEPTRVIELKPGLNWHESKGGD